MKKILFIIMICLLMHDNIYAKSNTHKILSINENTTPNGVYEQIGSYGDNVADDYDRDIALAYNMPMTVYYFDWEPFTICQEGCDGKAIILTFTIDEENQSFLRNTFKGIFKQKWKLSPLHDIQIIE